MWKKESKIETKASPETIWKFFSDVPKWPEWILGLESVEIKGPFKTGTEFVLTPKGQGQVPGCLAEVKDKEYFIDETRHGRTVIRVFHSLSEAGNGMTRITYSAEVSGPSEKEIGEGVTSDFMTVLKALKERAELM